MLIVFHFRLLSAFLPPLFFFFFFFFTFHIAIFQLVEANKMLHIRNNFIKISARIFFTWKDFFQTHFKGLTSALLCLPKTFFLRERQDFFFWSLLSVSFSTFKKIRGKFIQTFAASVSFFCFFFNISLLTFVMTQTTIPRLRLSGKFVFVITSINSPKVMDDVACVSDFFFPPAQRFMDR